MNQVDSELQRAGGIDKESRRGTTALTAAGAANQNEVLEILVKHGATVVKLLSPDWHIGHMLCV